MDFDNREVLNVWKQGYRTIDDVLQVKEDFLNKWNELFQYKTWNIGYNSRTNTYSFQAQYSNIPTEDYLE